MRITENDIKKKVVSELKKASFNVLATEVDEGFKKPAVFVNVYPSNITLQSKDVEDVSDTVEIKYYPAKETTEKCAEAAKKIRQTFMYKPLDVKERHLTIQSMEIDIENCVLYVYFEVECTQMTPDTDSEYEIAEELELGGI